MATTVKNYIHESLDKMKNEGKEIKTYDLNHELDNKKLRHSEMDQFNIFKALFSGNRIFKEEFASSCLGYLLSPFNSHHLRFGLLICLLEELRKKHWEIPDDLLDYLHHSNESVELFSPSPFANSFGVSLEYKDCDILIYIKTTRQEYILIFENKIYPSSETDIVKQLHGYKNDISGEKPENESVRYFLFAIHPPQWTPLEAKGNNIIHLSWAKSADTVCLTDLFRKMERLVEDELRIMLRQFIDFIETESPFNGYRIYTNPIPQGVENFLRHYNRESDAPKREFIINFIRAAQKANGFSDEQCDWDGPILMLRSKNDPRRACWPFKIKINNKIQIQHQGLKAQPFKRQSDIIEKIKQKFNEGIEPQYQHLFSGNYIPLELVANSEIWRKQFWNTVAWLQKCLDKND